MPFSLDQLAPLGTAGIIIALLIWWLTGQVTEKKEWIASFHKQTADQNVERYKNYDAMANLVSAVQRVSEAAERMAEKSEALNREVHALLEMARSDRIERK